MSVDSNHRGVQKVSRFRALSWPLEIFDANQDFKEGKLPLGDRVNKTRYPSRAMRYWWAACAIQDESRRLAAPPVIVDVACERGNSKKDDAGNPRQPMDRPGLESSRTMVEIGRV
jgi:hypothetical protein